MPIIKVYRLRQLLRKWERGSRLKLGISIVGEKGLIRSYPPLGVLGVDLGGLDDYDDVRVR